MIWNFKEAHYVEDKEKGIADGSLLQLEKGTLPHSRISAACYWVGFTAVILIWVVAASLSTPADFSKGQFLNSAAAYILKTTLGHGFHRMCQCFS